MSVRYDFKLPGALSTTLGNKLYLLGTSEDGPYMEPTLIKNKYQATKIFGSEDKGTLVKAFNQSYDKKEDISIYMMRITGKSATLEIEGFLTDPIDPKYLLLFRSIHAGEKYNETTLQLVYDDVKQQHTFYIRTPSAQFAYELPMGTTIESFTKVVNEDCRMGRHHVMVGTDYPDTSIFFAQPWLAEETPMRFGSDETDVTRNELYLALESAYQVLQGRPVDVIVPVEMYLDDVHPAYLYGQAIYGSSYYSSTFDYLALVDTENNNKIVSYHEQLIDFCREQMRLGYMTHGVIGIRPVKDDSYNVISDDSYIRRLAESSAFRDRHGFLDFQNGRWYDKGYFVSVVAPELLVNPGTDKEYIASGAVRYATILAARYDTTTNVPVGDDVELRYELSPSVMQELSRIGVVTFRDSVRKGLVVANGVTASHPLNELHNTANVRMVQVVLAYMNDAASLVYENDFEYDLITKQNYIDDLVKERMRYLKQLGIVEEYDYVISLRSDGVVGEIRLMLKGKHTIESIQVSATSSSREE